MQYNLRIQNVAVQLLYGRKVRSDDLLKISQTSLEAILYAEHSGMSSSNVSPLGPQDYSGHGGGALKRSRSMRSDQDDHYEEGDMGEDGDTILDSEDGAEEDDLTTSSGLHSLSRAPKLMRSNSWGPSSRVPASFASPLKRVSSSPKTPHLKTPSHHVHTSPLSTTNSATLSAGSLPAAAPTLHNGHQHVILESDISSSLAPYSSDQQLDYLEDCFQWIALMIKGNVAKMKDDMKKEGTSRNVTWGDNMSDIKHSKRELVAKIKLQEGRIEKRLKKTIETGAPLPRLEELVKKFELDLFEKGLLLLLIGKTVSPIVRTLLETLDTSSQPIADDVISVGQALSILCQNFHKQISSRRYFYQNSKLLSNALISLSKSRWNSGTGDLTENKILLDRRILDYIVGLDSEINELVEGSDLYTPNIPLDSVVLPANHKALLLSQCAAYDVYVQYRQHLLGPSESGNSGPSLSLERNGKSSKTSAIPYGNALVILLCGTPGTGKTMTVNAIATELKKKVLLCDFNSLVNKKDSQHADIEIDLKGLFRESKLSNALLFFDECEHIFKNRNYGSDRVVNSLLIEIEKHEGVVFLATNRPHELDEAMHRRITMVLEYSTPDKHMRKVIWDNLLAGMTRKHEAENGETSTAMESSPACLAPAEGAEKDAAAAQRGPSKIILHENVDTSILASKYELTGGFIKNAVLSAILMALARDKVTPIMHHNDLLLACQMQMRGNLTQKAFESRPVRAEKVLSKLYLSDAHKSMVHKILHFERSRSTVYGSWSLPSADKQAAAKLSASPSGASLATAAGSNEERSSDRSHPSVQDARPTGMALEASRFHAFAPPSGHQLVEKACITLLAGLQGSGKYTIVETIANELRINHIKYIHIGDFVNQHVYEVAEIFKVLIRDASILDAVIVINGFEHLLEDHSGEGAGNKVHLTLSRVMDILYDFRGPVFLLANLDNPQNILLQRDFSSRLFAFLRLSLPSADVRSKLWRALIPCGAPVASDLDFASLGRRFELFAGDIQSAIAFASAEVAARETNRCSKWRRKLTLPALRCFIC